MFTCFSVSRESKIIPDCIAGIKIEINLQNPRKSGKNTQPDVAGSYSTMRE